MTYRLNASLDDDYKQKLDEIVEDSEYTGHGAITSVVEDLIDAEFSRRELDLDGAGDGDGENEEEQQSIVEAYDPDDFNRELGKDELKELLEAGVRAINPVHVGYDVDKPRGKAVSLVAACTRYEHDAFGTGDVKDICKRIGYDNQYYLTGKSNGINVPSKVVRLLAGGEVEGDEMDEVTAEDNREDVMRQACAATMYGLWTDDLEQANDDIARIRQLYGNVDEGYRIDRYLAAGITDDVVRWALYELAGGKSSPRFKSRLHGSLSEVDWPDTAEGVVEKYIDEEDPGWADDDQLVKTVCDDLKGVSRGVDDLDDVDVDYPR